MYAGIGSLLGLRIVDVIKEKISPVALFIREQTKVVFLRTAVMDGPKKSAGFGAVDMYVEVRQPAVESITQQF
eukprot:gene11879-2429_t